MFKAPNGVATPIEELTRLGKAFTDQADLYFNSVKEAPVSWGHSADFEETGDEEVIMYHETKSELLFFF